MDGITYRFEELEPEGFPGVIVEGWADIEYEPVEGDFSIEAVHIGREGESKQLAYSDPLGKALFQTLYGKGWRDYIWDALKKYNED